MTWPCSRIGLTVAALLAALLTACSGDSWEPAATPPPDTAPISPMTPNVPSPVPGPRDVELPKAKQPAPPVTLDLLAHTDLGARGYAANVRALGDYAYVGSWGAGRCPAYGVRVVDLRNPAAPAVVATVAQIPGTSAEDIVPLHVATPAFTGDLLAVGIQRCSNSGAAPSGLALVDITDPAAPRDLGFFDTGRGSRGVHELDVTVRNGRVLALLAVPRSTSTYDSDLRIVDVSDPARPVQLSAWGPALAGLSTAGQGCSRAVYAHSVKASQDGTRAYASFWDAGLIILDITDPAGPRYLGRALDPHAEGAVHSVDITNEGLLVVAEEDDVFRTPRGATVRIESSENVVLVRGCLAFGDIEAEEVGVIRAPLVAGGTLCNPMPGNVEGVILADAGGCSLATKLRNAISAGAQAIVQIAESDDFSSASFEGAGRLLMLTVSAADGARINQLARASATITLPVSRPWGGVRVWDISDNASPVLVSVYHTEHAQAFPPPGPGAFTVHNPLSAGRYVFFSWYADGVRIVDFADPAHPVEVAAWVPPAAADPQRTFATAAEVWGVALHGDVVLVSDINGGLFVLKVSGLREAGQP